MQQDRAVLRPLAEDYARAAAHPRNAENAALYRGVNGLRMVRPVVLIDEEPWDELAEGGELELRCVDSGLRAAEQHMRRALYKWRHHPADMIVPPYLPADKIVGGRSGWPAVREHTLGAEGGTGIRSHEYEDQLGRPEDIDGLRMPALTYDEEATLAIRDRLEEAVGDIIPTRLVGQSCYISPWDRIATYRGVSNLLMDLVDRPEHTHAIMRRMSDMYAEQYRQLEALNLLEGEPLLIHCTAGLCDELSTPAGEPVLRRSIWGRGMAQIFASVSVAMHEEFDIAYQRRLMEPFGLIYYGCCEPLDKKMGIVSTIPRLRKVSITPWADIRVAAEAIGKRYVLSAKPNPARVGAGFDAEAVRSELAAILGAGRRYACNMEIVLKDISTVDHHPEHLTLWEKTAMELARAW